MSGAIKRITTGPIGFLIFSLTMIIFGGANFPALAAQEQPSASEILAAMTPEERVGQLFLVTFEGDEVGNDDEIAELIRDYFVGGVALFPENDNLSGFGDPQQTPFQVAELANDLQWLAMYGVLPEEPELIEDGEEPSEIVPTATVAVPIVRERALPLLIASANQGTPYEGQRPIGGLTRLPTNMAIGASWDPNFARQVGEIAGGELAVIGVNMLLGPSLDVLERPVPYGEADLGTLSFGGDPYWVGKMGQSYTEGVHTGSEGRVAVVAGSFPGSGSSDRPTDEEVPTVQKSLEQLKQIELAPFLAVTGNAPDTETTVDALFTTHIRYQGFQGNIRATTAPVSFDPQALQALMQLPEFLPWRENGGLIVSDSLGARSVRRFYDTTEQTFPHRVVAKDALLAGNDLLLLSNFGTGSSSYAEQIENVKDTITWFQEKYETDQSFQQRVDDAALRIIQLKLGLYDGDFQDKTY